MSSNGLNILISVGIKRSDKSIRQHIVWLLTTSIGNFRFRPQAVPAEIANDSAIKSIRANEEHRSRAMSETSVGSKLSFSNGHILPSRLSSSKLQPVTPASINAFLDKPPLANSSPEPVGFAWNMLSELIR